MIRVKKANQLPCFLEPVPFRQAGTGLQSLFCRMIFSESLQLFAARTFGFGIMLGPVHTPGRNAETLDKRFGRLNVVELGLDFDKVAIVFVCRICRQCRLRHFQFLM